MMIKHFEDLQGNVKINLNKNEKINSDENNKGNNNNEIEGDIGSGTEFQYFE